MHYVSPIQKKQCNFIKDIHLWSTVQTNKVKRLNEKQTISFIYKKKTFSSREQSKVKQKIERQQIISPSF